MLKTSLCSEAQAKTDPQRMQSKRAATKAKAKDVSLLCLERGIKRALRQYEKQADQMIKGSIRPEQAPLQHDGKPGQGMPILKACIGKRPSNA